MSVIRAAIYQFSGEGVDFRIAGDVTTDKQIADLVERIKKESGMIVYTIVSGSLRRLLHRLAVENHILAVDLFGPLITTMEKFFETVPLESPGLSYKLNRDYYRMVDAVDYTIRHDDGRAVSDIEKADVVLVGPALRLSRLHRMEDGKHPRDSRTPAAGSAGSDTLQGVQSRRIPGYFEKKKDR